MEVKKGYKRTEVGTIPTNWELKTFGEVFDFLPTASYARAQLENNGEAFYVHYGDIHTKFNFFLDIEKENLPTIQAEQLKNYSLLRHGDLIVVDASEDYAGINKSVEIVNSKGFKVIAGLHTFLLRDRNNEFVDGFRSLICCNPFVKSQFDRLATGLKVYGVSRSNLKNILIPIPSTKEQKAIFGAFESINNLESELNQLIQKKQAIKKSVMNLLLKPKPSWKNELLGNHVRFLPGFPFDSKFFNQKSKGLRLIKNRDLKSDDTTVYYDSQYPKDYIVNNGDVLIGMDGDFRPCLWNKGDALLNQRVGKLIALQKTNLIFMYYYLQKPLKAVENRTSSTTVKHLSHSDVENLCLAMPNWKEQGAIADCIYDLDKEIEGLEIKLIKYQRIKYGTMNQLLTGKTRLI